MTEVTSTEDRARKIVVEYLGVEPERVTADANFQTDLQADSLDTIEVVMAMEEEFGIEIPDDQMEACKTFGDALKLLEERVS